MARRLIVSNSESNAGGGMFSQRLSLRASVMALGLLTVGGLAAPLMANDDVLSIQSDPGQIVMPNITYNGWNYSELDQINLDNVQDLQVAWTFQIGVTDQHEAPPLVVGDTMYIVTPKPNYVLALDLNNDGSVIWEYRPEMNVEEATRQGCCGAQTRGLNYAEGKIFLNTLDGQVFGLDAETGEELWHNVAADLTIGETTTGNAIVIDDLYIVGNAGGERGVRGKISAFDINTGNLRWQFYSMGPNNEVGIGPRFEPFYADDQIANAALDSWYGDSWRRGGGTVWGYFTYDPDLNAFYYSTGNCGPWNPDYRREWGVVDLDENGGLETYRNNYCASLLARDGTTGELLWAYNITPQDAWDFDEPGTNLLVDLEIDGQTRHALVKAARNGFFYVFDRETGELINDPWPFRYVDFATGVDRETGRLLYNIEKIMFTDAEDRERYTDAGVLTEDEIDELLDPDAYTGTEVSICPMIQARNWQNDSYSPRTGLMYTSTSNGCGTHIVIEGEFTPGEGYTLRQGAGPAPIPNVGHDGEAVEWTGELQANDPVTGETMWSIQWDENSNTPLMSTAGDLVFQVGTNDGTIRAINATNGEIVWSFRTGANGNISPVTYLGPDGRQYVAYIASSASSAPQVAATAEPDAAARYRRPGSTLYVFALPESHPDVASAN